MTTMQRQHWFAMDMCSQALDDLRQAIDDWQQSTGAERRRNAHWGLYCFRIWKERREKQNETFRHLIRQYSATQAEAAD